MPLRLAPVLLIFTASLFWSGPTAVTAAPGNLPSCPPRHFPLGMCAKSCLVPPLAYPIGRFVLVRQGEDLGVEGKPTICIDPGHSRATIGAAGRLVTEVKVAWDVALRLRTILDHDGYNVVLTKQNQDENVRNEDRAGTANRVHAALFLRLHCDAGRDTGVATFYPARQGVKGGVRGPSKQVIAASGRCARLFHPAMVQALRGHLRDRGLRPDAQTAIGGQQGALTGSIFSKVPVILIEMCVLTNRRDERFIVSPQGQDAMAHALERGVAAAVGRANPVSSSNL